MNALQRYLQWARGTTAPVDGSQPGLYAYKPTTSERVGNVIQDRVGGQTGRRLADVARFVGGLVDPQQIARDVTNMTSNAVIATRRATQQPSAGNVANALIQDLMLGAAIIPSFRRPSTFLAAHSTPHEIKDRFDWRKYKGTGEGAQAFGDGTYLTTGIGGLNAPHTGSARAYAAKFAKPRTAIRLGNDDKPIGIRELYTERSALGDNFGAYSTLLGMAKHRDANSPANLRRLLLKRIRQHKYSLIDDLKSAEREQQLLPLLPVQWQTEHIDGLNRRTAYHINELQNLLAARQAINEQGLEVSKIPGNQYLVRVNTPYGDLPALDRPIMSREQPGRLHEFVRNTKEMAQDMPSPVRLSPEESRTWKFGNELINLEGLQNLTPLDVLSRYEAQRVPTEFSETLQAAGFPGVRYLEAGARGIRGARSIDLPNNVVMYDDSLIEILAKRPLGLSSTYTVPPLRKVQ